MTDEIADFRAAATLLFVSNNPDLSWPQRLEKACARAGVPYSQTAIGKLFEPNVNKQTVDTWMNGSLPRADILYRLADALRVDARWLATGDGDMLPRAVMEPGAQYSVDALQVAREFDDLHEPMRAHVRQQIKFLAAAQNATNSVTNALNHETSRVQKSTAAERIGHQEKKERRKKKER